VIPAPPACRAPRGGRWCQAPGAGAGGSAGPVSCEDRAECGGGVGVAAEQPQPPAPQPGQVPAEPGADLSDLLDTAMRTLAGVYSGRYGAAPQAAAP
jgi:hypothetical protein